MENMVPVGWSQSSRINWAANTRNGDVKLVRLWLGNSEGSEMTIEMLAKVGCKTDRSQGAGQRTLRPVCWWITEAFWWAQCLHASNVMTRAIHISMKASLDWIKAIPLRPRFLLCIPDTLFLIFSPSPIFLCDLFALFIKGYTGTTGLKDSHYAENLEKIIVQLHACPHT